MRGWDTYPLGVPGFECSVDNVYEIRERLKKNSDSLFVSKAADINLAVLRVEPSAARMSSLALSTIADLEQFLKASNRDE
jgi:hypothetical protein